MRDKRNMKAKDIIAGIVFLTFMIWFLGSWAEVQVTSGTGLQHEYCQVNLFVLLGEAVK